MSDIEWIRDGDRVLAILVSGAHRPGVSEFVTPDTYKQQLGFIVYPAGGRIRAHRHKEVARQIQGMSEVLVVRQGRCEATLYGDSDRIVAVRELKQGDVIVLVNGGHGFRMIEDTVLLEVKQGPYAGAGEKEFIE